MAEKKEGRGGKRKGAGRPKGDSRLFSFRCPGPLASRIEGMANRTGFINSCLEEALVQHAETQEQHIGPQGQRATVPADAVSAASLGPLNLPFFDIRVAAGFPIPLDNDEKSQSVEILNMLCPHPEASYLIRVNGDSMIDAGLFSGDIVIVDKSNRNPSPREIAMCELNGEYTLKRFVEENGQAWLVPANPAYPRFPVHKEDDFSIWGTVTYIIHKARD